MNPIDFRQLSVFAAVYRTRSVTGAAEALDISQSAVSVALSKMRHCFNDPLFVRTSAGMDPTPFAEGIIRPIQQVLDSLEVVLRHNNDFNPSTSERTFGLCMTDISQLILLPRLWETLRVAAPGIRIKVHPLTANTGRMLEGGEADLAVGFMPQLEAGFYQQHLFNQNFVCLVSKEHPRIINKLLLEDYECEEHAVISSSGSAPAILDREIARKRIKRKVVLEIPNFLGSAFVAEHTDLVITVPRLFGELLQSRGAFRIFPVPFPLPDYAVKQHWHERYHQDAGNKWLRSLISELMSSWRDA
jgi:DNA-binding transcriptional LysR family regulator